MTWYPSVRCAHGVATLVVPPAVEPLTPSEVKERRGLSASVSDSVLHTQIRVARQQVEKELGRVLIDQTWELKADAFPPAEIEIPVRDLIEVVAVTYQDEALVETTIDPLNYVIDVEGGWLIPAYGYSWPATSVSPRNARVRFRAGYGVSGYDVPEPIREWISRNVGASYASAARSDPSLKSETIEGIGSRSWDTSGGMASAMIAYNDRLLSPYRVVYF